MTRAERIIIDSKPLPPAPVHEFAASGWVVEVALVFPDGSTEQRFFAVGRDNAAEAEEAVLRYPGIVGEDHRVARRRLSQRELAGLALRNDAVRPYGSASDSPGQA